MLGNFVQGVPESGISMPNHRQANIGMSVDSNPLQFAKILIFESEEDSLNNSRNTDGVIADQESIYLRDLSSDLNSLCSILGDIDSEIAKLVK